MIFHSSKELLSEIKKHMDINDIQMKDLAVNMHKSPQSISQIFQICNPKLNTLFEICNALNLDIDFSFVEKSDTK